MQTIRNAGELNLSSSIPLIEGSMQHPSPLGSHEHSEAAAKQGSVSDVESRSLPCRLIRIGPLDV